jgi:ribosomal protein S18 acetylase RimI-like enzyme
VRLAAPEDAGAIADAHVRGWQAAYRGLVPDAILDGFLVEARVARWRDTLAARDAEHPNRTWVVADADGSVVGFTETGPGRDESAPPPDGAGEVYAIYLAPEARGRGYGRALFARAVDDLRSRDFDPIVVWVFEGNPVGRRFYEAAGFRPDGARYTIDFDGTPVDEIRYRLG